MSTTPLDARRRITPRRLGAAAVVYGVFAAGWYLGQPVTPDCHVDQAARDRAAEQYGTAPSPTHTYTPTPAPSAFADHPHDEARVPAPSTMAVTYTSYVVTCTNDMGERPRLQAWFEGDWK